MINLESSDVEASDWRLNPNYAKAFVNRAETYQKKNEYDRAASDYDEAIRLEPNLKAAWNGRCYKAELIHRRGPWRNFEAVRLTRAA